MTTKVSKINLPLILVISLGLNVFFLVKIVSNRQKNTGVTANVTKAATATQDRIFEEINPAKGYEINATYGQLGPNMLTSGVIDYDKFKTTYEKSGTPFPREFQDILKTGLDKKIRITASNSYFLLNFFWAVGLANKSRVLDEGDIIKYGGIKEAGSFASTGGWTLSKTTAMDYFSKSSLIPLTNDQEDLVRKVASRVFRPCCDNSTAFPDCNHGMALLGVFELMAANGATEGEMYEAGKYINAFWFPGNYYDLALYFNNKEGRSFKDMPGDVVLSKDYSSASGYQSIKAWLSEKGLIKAPPKQGGGCGV